MINNLRRMIAVAAAVVAGVAASVVGITPTPTASADCFLGFIGATCLQEEHQRVVQGNPGCWIFCPVEAPAAKQSDPWVWSDDNGGPTQPDRSRNEENSSKDCGHIGPIEIKQC